MTTGPQALPDAGLWPAHLDATDAVMRCPVPWIAVVQALLDSSYPMAVVQVQLTPQPGRLHLEYTTVSSGWRVEPSTPLIVRHYQHGACGPGAYRTALHAYRAVLHQAGFEAVFQETDLWPTFLYVRGRLPQKRSR